MKLIFREIMK